MSKQSVILSASGLKNIVINKEEEEEFIFKIGEKEMKMNKIFAEFISPRVSHIHQSDPTINFINLTDLLDNNEKSEKNKKKSKKMNKILEELGSENILTQIKKLSEGNKIEIDDDKTIKMIQYFSIIVNNEELYEEMKEIKGKNNDEEENDKEVLEELEFLYEMNPTFNMKLYSKLIDDLSSKMTSNNIKELQRIPKEIIYLILDNEHFQIEDMDSLFDFINEIFSEEKENEEKEEEYDKTRFYEIIDMSKLSNQNFEQFLSKLDYRELTTNLWTQLCEMLINNQESKTKATKEKENNKKYQKYEFDGQANHRFNGIIHHLQGTEKTNICDLGIINVTASSWWSSKPPKHAVDFDSNNYFMSIRSNDWLKYDFKEKKIRPTQYSIKTRNDSDSNNPINWIIEVSNTGKDDDWRIIDSRVGVTSVSKRDQSDTFDISTQLTENEFYRYIRFRCNGKTSGDCNCLVISSLEYFGNLIE